MKTGLASIGLASIALLGGCRKNDQGETSSRPKVVDQPYTVDTSGEVDPTASPEAVKGGVYTTWGGSFPKSLNMWTEYNSFTKDITDGMMFEPLVDLHSSENRWVGVLADSWTISPDQKVFTFHIDPRARWSDGKPVTAEDVLFYYDVIMNPKNMTPIFRVQIKRFDRPVVVDSLTIRFTAKTVHWANFAAAGNAVYAFPKHVWEGKDFNTLNYDFPVVSGPYIMTEVKKDRSITLTRRGDWWGRVKRYNQHKYNFDYLRYRFIEDQQKVLETFKKGDFDLTVVGTASIWAEKTRFDQVLKGYVARQRIFNPQPKSFAGFSMNLRRPLFQDPRVRLALAHLLNRRQMIEKLMFNEYFMLNSYFPDLYPNNINPKVPFIEYDPKKARELLAQAGWKVGPDGILAKDGKQFVITFLYYSSDLRHHNVYIEDLKAVGIKASVDVMSYSTLAKRMDNFEYDMFWGGWQTDRLRDPEDMWYSTTADEQASNNYPGVKDKTVDSLIDAQKTEMDLDKRNDICRKLDDRLNQINPYVLMWTSDHERLLYWNKFGMPKYVLDKYRDQRCVPIYWWIDPAKEKTLKDAMAAGKSLPVVDNDVHWQD